MKRRQKPTADDGPPPDIRTFRYRDWADESEPIPESWRTETGINYHHFAARRRWTDARRAWAAENGTTLLQMMREELDEHHRRFQDPPRT